MIDTLKNREGLAYAYVEWQVLDAAGYQSNDGQYIYVKNMWIHEKRRESLAFKCLINKIYRHPYSQKASFVYWEIVRDLKGIKMIEEEDREFSSKRMSKIFRKSYIVNKILKGEANVIKKIVPMQV